MIDLVRTLRNRCDDPVDMLAVVVIAVYIYTFTWPVALIEYLQRRFGGEK